MKLEPVIGLEIHVQLKTKSKMFCACDNTGESQPVNTTICPVCMGHPGTLPVPNIEGIRMAIRAALALNLNINQHSKFDRKNYFYPDLPKGYQISQYDEPLSQEGYLDIELGDEAVRVGIERLHLEEDTAKLLHGEASTLVDFNRAGTPLAEIVTKPDIKTPAAAKAFLQELRLIMRYLEVSEADMEKGHLRCDANISLRPVGESKLYPKTEIKNLNSFRSVEHALQHEIERQSELWQAGQPPTVTATRGWDEKKGVTVLQREKEAVHDYRYFPEPDIPPLDFTAEQIEAWRADLPELPAARRRRFKADYGLSAADAKYLVEDRAAGDFMVRVTTALASELEGDVKAAAKLSTNWIVHKLAELLNENHLRLDQLPFSLSQFVGFLMLVAHRQVNSTNAQLLLRQMTATGKDPEVIMEADNLGQLAAGDDDILGPTVEKIMAANAEQVNQYRAGKTALLKFFVGLVMRDTKGRVDPKTVEEYLMQQLNGK
jgi:aspartyl-tRNA(Asn)/glutamyl-tRNA(Gln) amidotransferase subunit B